MPYALQQRGLEASIWRFSSNPSSWTYASGLSAALHVTSSLNIVHNGLMCLKIDASSLWTALHVRSSHGNHSGPTSLSTKASGLSTGSTASTVGLDIVYSGLTCSNLSASGLWTAMHVGSSHGHNQLRPYILEDQCTRHFSSIARMISLDMIYNGPTSLRSNGCLSATG